MKLLTGCLMLAVLLGATGADAWPWSKRQRKLPRAIDSPIVRPKVKEEHKPGNRMRHTARVERAGWGREERLLISLPPHSLHTLSDE